MHDLEKISSSN